MLGATIRHPQPGVGSELRKFASDTMLFREAKGKVDCEELQKNLTRLDDKVVG